MCHPTTIDKPLPLTLLDGSMDRTAGAKRALWFTVWMLTASNLPACRIHRHSKQTGQEGCWHTVEIQTSFHSFLLLLVHLKLESKWTQGREVAQIQSTNCADWHSKCLRARISGCPPPGRICFNKISVCLIDSCEILALNSWPWITKQAEMSIIQLPTWLEKSSAYELRPKEGGGPL